MAEHQTPLRPRHELVDDGGEQLAKGLSMPGAYLHTSFKLDP